MKKSALIIVILFSITVVIVFLAALFVPGRKIMNNSFKPSLIGSVKEASSTVKLGSFNKVSATEVAKHKQQSDCWMIIEGNVYNLTPYFGMHPGGNKIMANYCGQDGSRAYQTQDGRKDHSAYARSLLEIYLVGPLDVGTNQ